MSDSYSFNMSDAIRRAEVHKVLSLLATEGGKDAKMLFMDAHESIDALPSVEPETGRWIEVEKNEYEGFSIVDMRCNQCGRYAYLVLPKGTKCVYDYCPNCGKRMLGEEGEKDEID